MRLLMGLLATQPFTATVDGHEGLRRRPMERIARPLRQMGAIVETINGHAPITITGARLAAIDYEMPVASAQLQTSMLLAALGAEGQMVLRHEISERSRPPEAAWSDRRGRQLGAGHAVEPNGGVRWYRDRHRTRASGPARRATGTLPRR